MTTLKIEKGVPIPPRRGSDTQDGVFPFKRMKQGDSLFVLCKPQEMNRIQSTLLMQCKYSGKSKKFTTRRNGKGVRIWRIK